jgi:nucleoid DNA-binding protein
MEITINYISLDTCTWIYIVNGTEPVSHLNFIKQELDKGNLRLILPKMVIEEWNRHKNDTVKKGTLKFFKETLLSLKRLAKLVGEELEEPFWAFLKEEKKDGDDFKGLIEKFQAKKKQIEESVKSNIETVESIFKHSNTIIIEDTDKIKLKASELAISKKAPFIKKNSFADAIIVLSFIEYVKDKSIEGAKFISYNTDDFCKKENGKTELHPDLAPFFNDTKSEFYKIVGEVLNTIKENIVSEETLQLIKERQEDIFDDDYSCEECDGNREGYGNVVAFWNEIDIVNEYDDTHQNSKYTTASVGSCEWCSALHIKCPKCDCVTCLSEYSFDENIECEGGCGITYFVDTSEDYEFIGERTIKIIDHRIVKCISCGVDFIDENCTETCDKCESEYNDN